MMEFGLKPDEERFVMFPALKETKRAQGVSISKISEIRFIKINIRIALTFLSSKNFYEGFFIHFMRYT